MIKLLNHTNSIQIRDIKKLPMPSFTDKDIKAVVEISKNIIKNLKHDFSYNFNQDQEQINKIVGAYFS
jgi:uncharacterized radical SAM superfamily Fe-S cluster-containing enzyme